MILCAYAEPFQTSSGKALSRYGKKCLLLYGDSGRDDAASVFCRQLGATKME